MVFEQSVIEKKWNKLEEKFFFTSDYESFGFDRFGGECYFCKSNEFIKFNKKYLFLLGDVFFIDLNIPGRKERIKTALELVKKIESFGKQTYLITGNHDYSFKKIYKGKKIKILKNGEIVDLEGIRFGVITSNQLSIGKAFKEFENHALKGISKLRGKNVEVLLSHCPAAKTMFQNHRSDVIRKFIEEEPSIKVHIFGHCYNYNLVSFFSELVNGRIVRFKNVHSLYPVKISDCNPDTQSLEKQIGFKF